LSAPGGFSGRGLEFAATFWSVWQGAFPDNQVTLKTVVGEGSEGAEESVLNGTHTGVLPSPAGEVPPTGRHVSIPFAGLHTVRNDKWVSFHVYFDQVELLTQLGLMPAPAAT
jgi:predicted ester cyclase